MRKAQHRKCTLLFLTPDCRLPTTLFCHPIPFIAHHQIFMFSKHVNITFVSMEVNDQLIAELAELARLEFNAEEKSGIKSDLQRMISFVEKLQEIDTTGVEPLLHMSEATNVYREDVVSGSIDRSTGLLNAPDSDGVYFRVPQVIKK
jgi:aspartyl-tRNA(Asn)/glutamyl-tRNA(Gln) amidotransferase subunit C